ncbi:uncharacterized protein J4E92_003151 [Alternaria infectoria]|uniref:uncharacterized protein n=1 Tax=Alternaria infectoria TaxID=45303 RepID=UPI00221EBE5A|nr:uncharacterized protein J4E92_003151 [Alternaria infectoria]KAI4933484.1 hypothetical protein J4E92_003151 [Alternaria infectoria]
MREYDSDNDGGIPLYNDQKSCKGLKQSILNLEELVNPNRSDYEHVGEKLILINELIKKIDPKYDGKQPYERIWITCREYPDTGEEIKPRGTKYEIATKMGKKSNGNVGWLIGEFTLLEDAVEETLQGVERQLQIKKAGKL